MLTETYNLNHNITRMEISLHQEFQLQVTITIWLQLF